MQTIPVDPYNYDKQLNNVLGRIKNLSILQINKKYIMDFYEDCSIQGLSKPRIIYYLNRLVKISKWLKKDFQKAKKDDIKKVVKKINEQNYTQSTRKDYRVTLKKFFRWLRSIDEKGVYPEEVRWITTTIKESQRILPQDLLTEKEIMKLIEAAEHPRDKALVATLAESGCRVGELLSLTMKNVTFDKYGAILIVKGKTGMRRVRVIGAAPYLIEWKNTHPQKDDPNSPLWIVIGTVKKIAKKRQRKYSAQWKYALSSRAASNILKKIAKKTGIKKRVNPHSFRHARATFLATRLTEAQLKEYFGWKQSSKMASIYVHLSGRDVDNAILKLYGKKQEKKEEKQSQLSPRKCKRCHKINGVTSEICKFCGAPLDLKTALEHDEKESKMISLISKMAHAMEKTSKGKIHFEELDYIIHPSKYNAKTITKTT